MNLPSDDDRLIQFLHQNRPEPPPASVELEAHIFSAISSNNIAHSLNFKSYKKQKLWFISSVCAASFLMIWNGYRLLTMPNFSSQEVASLETFLETNWDSINNSQPVENEWIWE